MPSAEELTARVQTIVNTTFADTIVARRRMFGSQAFLVGGNLACGVGAKGLMLRVDPSDYDELLGERGVEPMIMRGREMRGWMRVVDPDVLADDDVLEEWVTRGIDFAASLPPK